MSSIPLRIYHGPQDDRQTATLDAPQRQVTLPVGEILPLMARAVQDHRTWLADFDTDEMTISTDLYEVLLAYQFFHRPIA